MIKKVDPKETALPSGKWFYCCICDSHYCVGDEDDLFKEIEAHHGKEHGDRCSLRYFTDSDTMRVEMTPSVMGKAISGCSINEMRDPVNYIGKCGTETEKPDMLTVNCAVCGNKFKSSREKLEERIREHRAAFHPGANIQQEELDDGSVYLHDDVAPALDFIAKAAYDPIYDSVNHPSHYCRDGLECIDWIEAELTDEEFVGYCKGAALKYIWRYEDKGHPVRDISKAAWYLDRIRQKLEKMGLEAEKAKAMRNEAEEVGE